MVRGRILAVAYGLRQYEAVALLIVAPLLLFPNRLTGLGLAAVIVVWLLRWLATGRITVRTGLDIPILAVVCLIPVSLIASFDPQLSFPKLAGLILGVAFFYAIANAPHFEKRIVLLAGMILALGLVVSVIGVLGMEETQKTSLVGSLLGRLEASVGIARLAGTSFNSNEIGGTLAMLLPFSLSVVVFPGGRRLRAAAGVSAAALLVPVILAQSRWAFVTIVVSSVVILGLRNRRFWLGLPTIGLGSAVFVWLAGPAKILSSFGSIGSTSTVAGRWEIWTRALDVIRDYPLTGVGLNTFVPVTQKLYPYFLVPEFNFGHAHNVFLQVAVDLGLPGLAAVLAFFVWLIYLWADGFRRARYHPLGGIYVGFIGIIFAYLVFGLIDAIALGAKPSVLVWVVAGGIVATRRILVPEAGPASVEPARKAQIGWIHSRGRKVSLFSACAVGLILFLLSTPSLAATVYRNIGNIQLAKGVLAHDSKSLQGSEMLLKESISWEPNNGLAWRSLGEAYLARQSRAQAIDALKRGGALGSSQAVTYFSLGNAYQETGQMDLAIDAWRQAGAGEYFLRIGSDRSSARDYEGAEKYLRIAVSLEPQSYQAAYRLGAAALSAGDSDEAIRSLTRAAELGPGEVDAPLSLGEAYRQAHQYVEAENWYQKAAEIAPSDPWPAIKLGISYYETARYTSGVEQMRRALRLESSPSQAYYAHTYLARCYAKLNKLPEATAEYERAISLRPQADFLHVELGKVHFQDQRYPEAKNEFEQALKLNPQNSEARRQLDGVQKVLQNRVS